MLFNLLAVSPENAALGYPKNVSFGEAALYALIGFLVVFLGITLLIAIVWAVGKILVKLNIVSAPKKETVKVEKPIVKVKESEPVVVNNSDEPDEETVAVIMAALMAYYETNYPKCEFTVKRIKRL